MHHPSITEKMQQLPHSVEAEVHTRGEAKLSLALLVIWLSWSQCSAFTVRSEVFHMVTAVLHAGAFTRQAAA